MNINRRIMIWSSNFFQDARYGLRILARNPGFALVAVCSLGIGIGANTAIFSAIKTILLDSLNVRQPEKLRVVRWEFPNGQPMYSLSGDLEQTNSGATSSTAFSYPVYQALRNSSDSFENICAFDPVPRRFISSFNGEAEPVSVLMVSGNFFSTFEVPPVGGRSLMPADDVAIGSGPVIELSNEYWQRKFGGSKDVIGRVIQLNRVPVTVVGIAPVSFTGPEPGRGPDMYVPLTMDPILDPLIDPLVSAGLSENDITDGERWWLTIIGRIKPNETDQHALAAFNVAFRNAVDATLGKHHKDLDHLRLGISPGNRGAGLPNNGFPEAARVLIGVVALVLLLACANLANLLLARAASRQRELSLRIALGARRSRVMRQVLTESILISMLGGCAGFVLGYMARNLIPDVLHQNITITFDWKVVAFTLLISLFTAILFGGFPAWQATLTDMQSALKDSARITGTRSKSVLGKSLVVTQVSLSAVLLIGSGLFLTTLRNLMGSKIGFQPEHLLLFDLSLPETQYKSGRSRADILSELQTRIEQLPGVRTVTFSAAALLAGNTSTTNFDPNGDTSPNHSKAWLNVVGTDYFETMGIPIVAGRQFNEEDSKSRSKVAIINLRLAREFFPHRNPIGITFNDDHIRIVGISGDAKFKDLRMDPPPTYYLLYQQVATANSITFAVKTSLLPTSLTGSIRSVVESVDRDLPVTNVRTQQAQLNDSLSAERLFASLTGGFGFLALLLACIGIYGLTAYTVSRRTNEIGIRMALGAQRQQILRMILREGCILAIIGIGIAFVLALVMGRLVQTFLYGLHPTDPLVLTFAASVLMIVTLTASWLPARKAASIDPMRALRHE